MGLAYVRGPERNGDLNVVVMVGRGAWALPDGAQVGGGDHVAHRQPKQAVPVDVHARRPAGPGTDQQLHADLEHPCTGGAGCEGGVGGVPEVEGVLQRQRRFALRRDAERVRGGRVVEDVIGLGHIENGAAVRIHGTVRGGGVGQQHFIRPHILHELTDRHVIHIGQGLLQHPLQVEPRHKAVEVSICGIGVMPSRGTVPGVHDPEAGAAPFRRVRLRAFACTGTTGKALPDVLPNDVALEFGVQHFVVHRVGLCGAPCAHARVPARVGGAVQFLVVEHRELHPSIRAVERQVVDPQEFGHQVDEIAGQCLRQRYPVDQRHEALQAEGAADALGYRAQHMYGAGVQRHALVAQLRFFEFNGALRQR